MENRKISIIMTYYNRKMQLLVTLTTLKNQTYKNFEVIIYDDNSDDEHSLNNIINNYDFNIVLLKRGDESKKYTASRGYNLAEQKATGDILIIQNPECCYVQNNLLEYVNNNLNDTNYLVFSCYNLNSNAEMIKLGTTINDESNLTTKIQTYITDCDNKNWYQHSIYKPVGFHFTCAIMKKNYEKMNGFDERYCNGIDYDDAEFFERIKLFLDVKMIDEYNVIHLFHNKFRYVRSNIEEQRKLEKLRQYNKNLYLELVNNKIV